MVWDGMLPVLVAALGAAVQWLGPGQRGIGETMAVIAPIGAFLVRWNRGRIHFANYPHYLGQRVVFMFALMLLALLDSCLILFRLVPHTISRDDWIGWALLYSVYLTMMAVAFFPKSRAAGAVGTA
jgi:hypothetical protein